MANPHMDEIEALTARLIEKTGQAEVARLYLVEVIALCLDHPEIRRELWPELTDLRSVLSNPKH